MQAHKVSRDIPLPYPNLGAVCGWVAKATPRPLYPREKAPVPIVEEAGWAPGSVGMGVEKRKSLAPIGVRIPDCATRSKSLYRLC
jgi:hypothetical protein